jgi:osmotically-inducible protein OsmY
MFRLRLLTMLLLIGTSTCSSASAQLVGDRDISSNRTRAPKDLDSAATVTGSEKFVRGNRTAGDFVGAGDTEESTFVGASQAAPTAGATDSVTGLAEQTAPQVNIPKRRRATGIYAERLTIGFESHDNAGIRLPAAASLSKQLSKIISDRGYQLQLSPGDSTAKLTGTVESQQKKRIAELLVLFEPGISTVENELRVEPKLSR